MNKYYDGNKVSKEKVAMDIKYRELDRRGIEELLECPGIEKCFVGSEYSKKISRERWTEDYLDSLSYSAATECFNRDYLYYLNDVAAFIADKKNKKKISMRIMGVVVIVLVIILIFMVVILLNKNRDYKRKLSEAYHSISVALENN
jgi:signal transduction histidine kinase